MLAQHRSPFFPALSCITAAILWGVLWYPLRLLEGMGVPGLWATLLIYCSAIIFVIPFCWQRRKDFFQNKTEYFLLALFAGWTNLAFILAMLEGEVVRVLMLFYLSPVWAIILAIFILKESLTASSVVALLLALTGAVFMLWHPDFFSMGFSLADIYAITSGMAFAITNIVVRKAGEVPWSLKIGAAWIGVIILTLIGLTLSQTPLPEMSGNSFTLAFLVGFPFMLLMTWSAQYGVTYLPIQRSSVIFLLEIVAGAVSAAFLTNEIVSNREYLGGILIISAGLLSVFTQKSADPLS